MKHTFVGHIISANHAAHAREVLEINQYSIVVFIVNDALAIGAHQVTDPAAPTHDEQRKYERGSKLRTMSCIIL
jgi:hypothetical protein